MKEYSARPPRQPGIWFRVVHVALETHQSAPVAAYNEQTVEIALGPNGAFEIVNVGILTRRVAADRVVHVVPSRVLHRKPHKSPKTPRLVELLGEAIE